MEVITWIRTCGTTHSAVQAIGEVMPHKNISSITLDDILNK